MALDVMRGSTLALVGALAIGGCSGAPDRHAAGDTVTFEGRVVSVDTQPWAYDGNAVVVVDSATRGRVAVQLPARWNLCRAAPVDVGRLESGSRARVVGETGAEGEVVVCADASHRLERVD